MEEKNLVNTEIISKDGKKFNLLCHSSLVDSTKRILMKYNEKDIQEYIKRCNQMPKNQIVIYVNCIACFADRYHCSLIINDSFPKKITLNQTEIDYIINNPQTIKSKESWNPNTKYICLLDDCFFS